MSEPTDERYTPEHVIDVVRMFAPIGLDPCSTPDNRKLSAAAKQSSIMPYWGSSTQRFERVFSQLGKVWVRS